MTTLTFATRPETCPACGAAKRNVRGPLAVSFQCGAGVFFNHNVDGWTVDNYGCARAFAAAVEARAALARAHDEGLEAAFGYIEASWDLDDLLDYRRQTMTVATLDTETVKTVREWASLPATDAARETRRKLFERIRNPTPLVTV
jgi:hypothetical protein